MRSCFLLFYCYSLIQILGYLHSQLSGAPRYWITTLSAYLPRSISSFAKRIWSVCAGPKEVDRRWLYWTLDPGLRTLSREWNQQDSRHCRKICELRPPATVRCERSRCYTLWLGNRTQMHRGMGTSSRICSPFCATHAVSLS